jgi:predicted RNA polymerase sigma factor
VSHQTARCSHPHPTSSLLQAALKRLDEEQKFLLDRVTMHETRARLLLKLGRNDEAAKEYAALVDDNPEDLDSVQNYAAALGFVERSV